MTSRQRDELVERIVNQFEDEFFWSKILKDKLSCMTRYNDVEHQFAGIDFALSTANFDSKVKYHGCLNNVQPVVGFELTFLNRAGNVQDGWFMNDELSTDWYQLVGISATTQDEHALSSVQQICAIDVLWVKKQDLKEAVEKKVSTQKLKEHAEELRREGDENYTDIFGNRKLDSKGRARRKIDGSKCMWITYSTRPVERPVNLVVTREMLESLPHTRHFIVTKDRVVKGKLS